MHIDPVLLMALLVLMACGLGILYSASDGSVELVQRQIVRLSIAFIVMFLVAQIPQQTLYHWAPWFFALGIILLILVLVAGDVGKGRSEEHTSELQSRLHLVCRLLLEKKKKAETQY